MKRFKMSRGKSKRAFRRTVLRHDTKNDYSYRGGTRF